MKKGETKTTADENRSPHANPTAKTQPSKANRSPKSPPNAGANKKANNNNKAGLDHNEDLVVVGASAGGVGALTVLVSNLRENFPAPVVIAQHLDPKRPSNLGAILERRSPLPIVIPNDKEKTKLEKGTVYVIPSNRHVTIRDGHINLEGDRDGRPLPSVDMLLSSAAKWYGDRLVAVILTGAGRDGAAGAIDVKKAGGTVIVQNPQTAQYPSMPLSLLPTVIDHVADVEHIGPLLHEILERVHQAEPKEKIENPLRGILDKVKSRASIDFGNYKPSTIMRRVLRRAVITRNPSIQDYEDYLRTHPDEIDTLVKAFLIKVTGFFRDPEAFEYLKENVIPDLLKRGRENGRVLRCWSAGCATGEEAYSLALLIADSLGNELLEWSVKIFATDVDEQAVGFARHGVYPEAVLQDLPDNYLQKYFDHADSGYHISKPLRQMVIFGNQDLGRGVPFPRIDLVACRNVLIYLKPELQSQIIDLFAYSLHQTKGFLFLGKAETARPAQSMFELVNKKWKVYRCKRAPITTPEGLPKAEFNEKLRMLKTSQAPARPAPVVEFYPDEMIQVRRVNETLMRLLPIGVIMIDRNYRVISMNSTARRFLGIRDIPEDHDFLHAARVLPYNQVRSAIDTAFRERTVVNLTELELQSSAGDGRFVNFNVMLMQTDPERGDYAAISLVDCTETVQTRRRLEAVEFEQAQLVNDLGLTNRQISNTNKELMDTNEELQAANEELLLTQEELQATNEEFEATNEELQATNEELETNNEELQATNEELQTTNDELTARTHELQDASKKLADQRIKLREIMRRAPFNIMVLDGPRLIIESYNEAFGKLLTDRDVKGHAFEEIFHDGSMRDLIEKIHEARRTDVITETGAIELTYSDRENREHTTSFTFRIVPIHASDNSVEAVAIYANKT